MPEIKLHNTLSGQVEPLRPRDGGHVGIYVCGPTVYARIHIGNARPFVVFALYKRFLEHEGYRVTLVENITDINDKIYDAARKQGTGSAQLADEMGEAYIADTDRLQLGRPDHEPLASETMPLIVELISALIERGHAYSAGGDVYFRVRSFDRYGALSNRRVAELESQEPGEHKEDPLDFALWKAHKDDEDSQWDSPWGAGRPGWHIECSAMAEALLGLDFDIHGGGADLIFPHHENEIAQTACARDAPLARIWMHNGMIRLGEEKMAKSVGNITLLADVLDTYGRDAAIMYFVSGHYRQPLTFSAERMREAKAALDRLGEFVRLARRAGPGPADENWLGDRRERFFAALADDFNTPRALAALFELVADGNRRAASGEPIDGAWDTLLELMPCLGLETLCQQGEVGSDERAKELLSKREELRQAGDFAGADQIRAQIEALGYQLRDTPQGTQLVQKS